MIIRLFCLLCCLFSSAAQAEYCKPHRFVDGDTFHFYRGEELVKVRVAGFDAPERGQPYSRVATAKLRDLTEAGADCDCFKKDKYKRDVCRVKAAGQNVSTSMLEAGFGCIDARFVGEDSSELRQSNAAALESAKAARVGVWVDELAICGKEFRDSKRAK